MSKEKLFMDQIGIDKLRAEIESLKSQLSKKTTFNREDTTDGYNTSIAEANRHDETLIDLLNLRLRDLSRVVLIEKQENSDLIDLDDILEVNFNADGRRLVFQLVGRDGDFTKEVPEISVNSPIGQAVYKKHVGDICSYKVVNNTLDITIIQKLSLNDTFETPKR